MKQAVEDVRFKCIVSDQVRNRQMLPGRGVFGRSSSCGITGSNEGLVKAEVATFGDAELRQSGWQHITAPRSIAQKLYADVNDETPEQVRARQAAAAAPAPAPAARAWWNPFSWW